MNDLETDILNDPESHFKSISNENDYDHAGRLKPAIFKLPFPKEPGYSYIRARHNTTGVEDSRVDDLISEGWELVRRGKEKKNDIDLDPLNKNPNAKLFYFCKDTIILKIPTHMIDKKHMMMLGNYNKRLRSLSHTFRPDPTRVDYEIEI